MNNTLCIYCKTQLNKENNQPNSRTVEHLIPNSLTSKKRNKNNGDFYVCKRCNSHKSMMDNLVGKVAKFQSFDDQLAVDTMVNEYTKDKRNNRLSNVLTNGEEKEFGIYGKLPFNGEELYSYMEYLGKGQYFKKTGKIFSKSKNIMTFLYLNKEFNIIFGNKYKKLHGTNNFRDLAKNGHSEVINEGECIIYAKEDNKYMFVFHSHTVIIISIYKSSNKTKRIAQKNKQKILHDFS